MLREKLKKLGYDVDTLFSHMSKDKKPMTENEYYENIILYRNLLIEQDREIDRLKFEIEKLKNENERHHENNSKN